MLIKRVKIANSFLQYVSNQFHVIILSLPMFSGVINTIKTNNNCFKALSTNSAEHCG